MSQQLLPPVDRESERVPPMSDLPVTHGEPVGHVAYPGPYFPIRSYRGM